MTDTSREVLLDTNVFNPLYVRASSAQSEFVTSWRRTLTGRPVAISFQTRQEVLAGALNAGWGERKIGDALAQMDRTATVWASREVVEACAQLYAECRARGHPLHNREHMGDRWIAACALAHGLALASDDGVFDDVPRLDLLKRTSHR